MYPFQNASTQKSISEKYIPHSPYHMLYILDFSIFEELCTLPHRIHEHISQISLRSEFIYFEDFHLIILLVALLNQPQIAAQSTFFDPLLDLFQTDSIYAQDDAILKYCCKDSPQFIHILSQLNGTELTGYDCDNHLRGSLDS